MADDPCEPKRASTEPLDRTTGWLPALRKVGGLARVLPTSQGRTRTAATGAERALKPLLLGWLGFAGFMLEQTLAALWDAEAMVDRWL
jgi:hypothetical protein